MKRFLCIALLALLAAPLLHAQQQEETVYTDAYLDSLDIGFNPASINDYHMIGVNYGVTFSTMYFNPLKGGSDLIFTPHTFSLMYTHHEKMFNYIPYFGLTMGVSYSHSGARFNMDPETGLPLGYIDGATEVRIATAEVPAMMEFHYDSQYTKVIADLGGYVGYRLNVERSGDWMDPDYATVFHDYERRFDYGLCGGVGFGVVVAPVELHLKVMARWSFQNLYDPDYYNEFFHPYNTYYYRFANPIDVSLTLGIYFHLSKRHGKTNLQLRREAKEIVYGTTENN